MKLNLQKYSMKHNRNRTGGQSVDMLNGPLLSKNPKLCDHIINYTMTRKTGEKYTAQPINDKLEEECREQLFARLLK